jgi:hypothetical protein
MKNALQWYRKVNKSTNDFWTKKNIHIENKHKALSDIYHGLCILKNNFDEHEELGGIMLNHCIDWIVKDITWNEYNEIRPETSFLA